MTIDKIEITKDAISIQKNPASPNIVMEFGILITLKF